MKRKIRSAAKAAGWLAAAVFIVSIMLAIMGGPSDMIIGCIVGSLFGIALSASVCGFCEEGGFYA